jgi:hypothetical protein
MISATINNRTINLPLHFLQRHPLTVRAHFDYSLVLTYAIPRRFLEPLLPPGLQLDTFENHGFVAIALVQTRGLRPALFPACMGRTFFLAGYRIFTTFKPSAARTLRGLYILRSSTNRRLMVVAGNMLTHYRYRMARVTTHATEASVQCRLMTRNGEADLDVTADLSAPPQLPQGSPFSTLQQARRYAGPLPYTFDHEPETKSIIAIKGERRNWNPRLVPVEVRANTFLERGVFARVPARLASAFYVADIDYQWNPGIRHPLTRILP